MLYSSSNKIDEHLSYQRPSYDKIGLGYLIGEKSIKKAKTEKEPDLVVGSSKETDQSSIKSSRTIDKVKEIDLLDLSKSHEEIGEAKKDDKESFKETRYVFRGKCYSCNEVGHMKRDCKNKSFKHVTNFYCYNCHGLGHKVVNYEKPKFDNTNVNSRMFRNTNPVGNKRGRS